MCGTKFWRSPGSSEYTFYTFPGEQHSSSILLWNSYNVFVHGIEMLSNIPTLHTRTHTLVLPSTRSVPVSSFQSASVLPLLSYEAHTAGLHKDQREEFLKAAKSMPVIILPATQSHKSIKNMATHLIILRFKYSKRQKNKWKNAKRSQWIKQTTESRWWKRCRGFIYYNVVLTPKNNSLINILHNNGINSSLHW